MTQVRNDLPVTNSDGSTFPIDSRGSNDDEIDIQLQFVFPSGLVAYNEGLSGGPITTVSSCTGGSSNPESHSIAGDEVLAPGASGVA